MKFKDQTGRQVILNNRPQRIISLVPSITDLLAYIGLEKELVGITKFCVHPPHIFRTKKRVGGTKNINYELIETLQPDLIIANKEENNLEMVQKLEKKYPVYVSDVSNIDDALDMIKGLGDLLQEEKTCKDLTDKIKEDIFLIKSKNIKPRKSAYLVWNDPIMACGSDTYIDSVMKLLGYENVFIKKTRYPKMEIEELKALDPEVLLLPSEPFPFKEKHKEVYKDILPDCDIKLVNGEIFSWYGSYMLNILAYTN